MREVRRPSDTTTCERRPKIALCERTLSFDMICLCRSYSMKGISSETRAALSSTPFRSAGSTLQTCTSRSWPRPCTAASWGSSTVARSTSGTYLRPQMLHSTSRIENGGDLCEYGMWQSPQADTLRP